MPLCGKERKNHMKKLLALLLTAIMCFALCGAAMADEEVVEIEFWYSFEEFMREPILAEIANFEAANPGVKVIASYAGSYSESNQKLLAAHAANQVPAVQQTVQTAVATFAANGVIYPIDEYIAANGDDMSNYAAGMYAAFNYEGKQYGLPAFCSVCPTFYYNKTFAEQEGIEIPKTWDEMDAFLRKATIKNEDGTTARYGLSLAGWGTAYFGPIWYANGASVYTDDSMTECALNSEASMAVINKIKGWVDEGLVKWYYGSGASASMRQGIIDGISFGGFHTCAVFDVYKSGLGANGWEVGTAFNPAGVTTVADLGGSGLTLMAKASEKQREYGYKLIKWLSSPSANMIIIRATGYLPVTTDCLNSEACAQWLEENPCLNELYAGLDAVQAVPSNTHWSDIGTKWQDAMAQIFNEGADVEATVEFLCEEINELLADD